MQNAVSSLASRVICLLVLGGGSCAWGGVRSNISWIDPDGVPGHLVLVGGGAFPAEARAAFLKLAGGDKAKLVVIPTAAANADEQTAEQVLAMWKDVPLASLTVLHTRDRALADDDEFVKPLQEATAVWFHGGSQSLIAEAYLGTKVERALYQLLERGGTIGGTSAGAAIASRTMIASGNPKPEIRTGLNLLPGAIVDQHFSQRGRQPRLRTAIAAHPELFGLGLDEGTAVVVSGRLLRVVGAGGATLVFAEGAGRSAEEQHCPAGSLLDLTSLRRRAQERLLPAFPPARPVAPVVERGSLVIVGGGGMPLEVGRTFVELAGGPEALIVILPTAVPPDPNFDPERETQFLRRLGARNVRVLDARRRDEVESAEFEQVIADAGGLWFGGGRQWRFVDAYAGTRAEEWFHALLERGGVIGGSSAGASIQAEYLARGNPLGNLDIMVPGYERGLGFLPGTAVDQHFAQRNRFPDMASLVERYPQLLGIGIDEATAIIVRGSRAEVMGRGRAHFFDRSSPKFPGEPVYESLPAGMSYDLQLRRTEPLTAPRP